MLARAIGDDATAVLRIFSGRGTHIASKKLKVSSLRCYNLLVARTPILCITGLFERTPTVFIMGTAEILCCVPSHAGRFTSLPTPPTNWQSKGSGQARDVLKRAGLLRLTTVIPRCNLLRERETGVMNSLKAPFVWGNAGIVQLVRAADL